jgi:hypothetical protein
MKRVVPVIGLLSLCALPVFAHHGKDFLIVESYELPHKGDVYFVSSEMFSRARGETIFATEPSLLFGLGRQFAGEVHVHFLRLPGESLKYEAVAPAIHYQFTPPESDAPWKLAVAAEYEIARHSDENSLAARLIAAHDLGEGQVILNVGGDHSKAGGTHASYAAGFRPAMEARVTWGIEAQGRLQHGDEHQLIVGLYMQPNERFTFKAGAGVSLGNGKPSAVIRTGVVWHF